MKKIFKITFILISSLFIFNCKAQNSYPQDGDNIINNNLDKFVGIWNWSDGTESLQLILKKENILLPIGNNIRADALYGFHKYVKNNTIIEGSTEYMATTYTQKKSTLFALGRQDTNLPNELGLAIHHTSKNKSIDAKIIYIDSTHIKLVQLKNYPGLKVNVPGKPSYDWSISLPENIILTKQ